MEQLGFWELVHATSAGGVSIFAWEGMKECMAGGPLLFVAYAGVMFAIFKMQQLHLKKVRKLREAEKSES